MHQGSTRCRRTICAWMLLALLACSGYIGRQGVKAKKTISVSAVRTQYEPAEILTVGEVDDASARHRQEREREIELLQGLADNPLVDETIRRSALEQIQQIVWRMEMETQAASCLQEMGYQKTAIVCGAQMMTVIAPFSDIGNEHDRMRVIDAVSALTGLAAADIKIIITKN